MRRFCQGVCCALVLGLSGTGWAEPFRTLIVIDASSSMRRTDPQKLRKVAAELYVDLARDGDSIAIAQFQAEAKDVSGGFQTITGPAMRDRLKDAIRSIGDDGDWTDFGTAFDMAAKAFAAVPVAPLSGEKRFLVFLTDGKCEPAPGEPRYLKPDEKPEKGKKAADERESRCKSYVLSQSLPAAAGVEMEIIGLSKSAPREFLEEVGRRTGGSAVVTEKAEDLPHLFAKIHAFNSGARVAEASKDLAITVDKLVASLDLVVVAPKDLELSVERPDGTPLPTDDRALYVVRSERYRFFHIPRPVPGSWKVKPARKLLPAAIAAIQNFDLRLELKAEEHATVGSPLDVHVALVAGEGGGMPEASFLARHKFSLRAKVEGAFQEIPLSDAPDGGKSAKFVPAKAGTVELSARVEPGPEGALTRYSGPRTITVVPPLKLVSEPISLGELKPGARVERKLDLSKSEFLGEVRLEADLENAELSVKPRKLDLRVDQTRFDLAFDAPGDAKPGPVSGSLALTPKSKPYIGREGAKVPVQATILELTFWEKHGTKVVLGALFALLVFVVAGFKTPARFPKKLRVWYQDKPNADDGDFGLWLRGKPGFYRPGTFRIGGGGPIRRSSALICEIVATKDGVMVRPAPGKTLKKDGEELGRPFRPEYKAKYEAEDGLVFWVGKEEEEE